MQSISSSNLKGIDVSNWQGTIDFNAVKNSGIQIIYTKVSEGVDYIDPFFKTNYTQSKANNLKIGFYHFFTPTPSSPPSQPSNFISYIVKSGDTLSLIANKYNTTSANLAKINNISNFNPSNIS